MKVKFRRGTEAEWDRYNPTLRDREIGLVLETGRFKVGDGKSAWADLDWSTTLPFEMVIGYEPPPHKPDWTDSVRVKFGSTPTLAYDDWLEHFRGKGDVVAQPKRRHWFQAVGQA